MIDRIYVIVVTQFVLRNKSISLKYQCHFKYCGSTYLNMKKSEISFCVSSYLFLFYASSIKESNCNVFCQF